MIAANESVSASLRSFVNRTTTFFAPACPPGVPGRSGDAYRVAAGVGHVEDQRVGSAGGVDERLVDLGAHRAAADDDDGPVRRPDLDRALPVGPSRERVAESLGSRCWF